MLEAEKGTREVAGKYLQCFKGHVQGFVLANRSSPNFTLDGELMFLSVKKGPCSLAYLISRSPPQKVQSLLNTRNRR